MPRLRASSLLNIDKKMVCDSQIVVDEKLEELVSREMGERQSLTEDGKGFLLEGSDCWRRRSNQQIQSTSEDECWWVMQHVSSLQEMSQRIQYIIDEIV